MPLAPSLVAAALLIVGVVAFVVVLRGRVLRDGVLLGRCVEVAATAMIFVLPVCRVIVPRAPLVLDLAHRDARKPHAVVDRGRRSSGGVFARRGMGQRRRPRLRACFPAVDQGARSSLALGSGGRPLAPTGTCSRARLSDDRPLVISEHPRSLLIVEPRYLRGRVCQYNTNFSGSLAADPIRAARGGNRPWTK